MTFFRFSQFLPLSADQTVLCAILWYFMVIRTVLSIFRFLVTPTSPKVIKNLQKEGSLKMVMGGDDNMSQLVLLPIKELFI